MKFVSWKATPEAARAARSTPAGRVEQRRDQRPDGRGAVHVARRAGPGCASAPGRRSRRASSPCTAGSARAACRGAGRRRRARRSPGARSARARSPCSSSACQASSAAPARAVAPLAVGDLVRAAHVAVEGVDRRSAARAAGSTWRRSTSGRDAAACACMCDSAACGCRVLASTPLYGRRHRRGAPTSTSSIASSSSSPARAASARRRSPRRSRCSARTPAGGRSSARSPGSAGSPACSGIRRPAARARRRPSGPELWSTTVDPEGALAEWAGTGRAPARGRRAGGALEGVLAASSPPHPARASWSRSRRRGSSGAADRWRPGAAGYDLVVLDAPASGHGLGLLRTPRNLRGDRARRPDREPGAARDRPAGRPATLRHRRGRDAPRRRRSARRSSCRTRSSSSSGACPRR